MAGHLLTLIVQALEMMRVDFMEFMMRSLILLLRKTLISLMTRIVILRFLVSGSPRMIMKQWSGRFMPTGQDTAPPGPSPGWTSTTPGRARTGRSSWSCTTPRTCSSIRWMKRKMEAENKKVRDKARKERNEVVRNLVQFVRKRDKRLVEWSKKLQEKAELNKKKTEVPEEAERREEEVV